MEVIYSAPEEFYSKFNITIGILGLKRSDFDEMLVKKKIKKKKRTDEEDQEDDEKIEEEEDEENVVEKPFEFSFRLPKKFIHRYLQ